jgi:hypothetical protein
VRGFVARDGFGSEEISDNQSEICVKNSLPIVRESFLLNPRKSVVKFLLMNGANHEIYQMNEKYGLLG